MATNSSPLAAALAAMDGATSAELIELALYALDQAGVSARDQHQIRSVLDLPCSACEGTGRIEVDAACRTWGHTTRMERCGECAL